MFDRTGRLLIAFATHKSIRYGASAMFAEQPQRTFSPRSYDRRPALQCHGAGNPTPTTR